MNLPSESKCIVPITLVTFLACLLAGCGSDEASLLCRAARDGNDRKVEELLNKGADVNAQDKWFANRTSLHWAALRGDKEMAALLIEKGANIDGRDFNGKTPLHLAAEGGNIDTVGFLVDKGADVNAVDDGGGSPVWSAVFAGKEDVMQFLMDNGAILPPPESRNNRAAWSAWNWKNSPTLNETAKKSPEAESGEGNRIPGPLVILIALCVGVGLYFGLRAALLSYLRRPRGP